MPAIAVTADNRPQLVWIDNNWDVVYRGTTAGGWGPIQNWGNAKQEYRPDICIDSLGRIAVAWCANYDDGYGTDVHWRLFENGQWSAITAFSQTVNGSDNIALAAFPGGGGFYAVWEAANAQSNSYTCQGRRWNGTLGPVETIGGWAYGQYDLQYYVDPDVAIDQAGNIHVVYCVRNNPETMWEDKIHDVFYRRYNGSTWEPRVNLSRATDFIWSSGPAIALDGDGTPHVIFLSSLAGEGIYYVTRTESGWTNPVRISVANVPPGAAYEPSGVLAAADSAGDLVIDAGGTLHVVWNARNAGGADVYYRTRTGSTWSGIDNLTANASWSERARLALAPNGTLHLVYSDNISGNTEVYYRSLDPLTAPTRTFTATPTWTLTPTITPTPTITNTPRPRSPTPTPVQAAETNLRLW